VETKGGYNMSGIAHITLSEEYINRALPALRESVKHGAKIIEILRGEFIIEGQELTFLCPENIQRLSLVFRCKRGILGGSKSFPFPNIEGIRLRSLTPLQDITSEAIQRLDEGGFRITYKPLIEESLYMLDVDFEIESEKLLDSIVHKRVQRETPHEDKRQYWMHAQLRFVEPFRRMFSNLRLEDLDFGVNVGVHEDIKTSVPSDLRRELELIVRWIKTRDREEKARLSREHLRLKRRSPSIRRTQLLKILENLQELFLPSSFRRFLDVKRDFYYHDCYRGCEYYTLPFPTWPKFMRVISRTNLTLNKPAAEGVLEFKQRDFKKTLEDIFVSR
jgi:hypothetical protein